VLVPLKLRSCQGRSRQKALCREHKHRRAGACFPWSPATPMSSTGRPCISCSRVVRRRS
jgi:hypothetical protein